MSKHTYQIVGLLCLIGISACHGRFPNNNPHNNPHNNPNNNSYNNPNNNPNNNQNNYPPNNPNDNPHNYPNIYPTNNPNYRCPKNLKPYGPTNPNNSPKLPGYNSNFPTLEPGMPGYNPNFPAEPTNSCENENSSSSSKKNDSDNENPGSKKRRRRRRNPNFYPVYDGFPNGADPTYGNQGYMNDNGNYGQNSYGSNGGNGANPVVYQPGVVCLMAPTFGNPAGLVSSFLANLNSNLSAGSSTWNLIYQNASNNVYNYIFSLSNGNSAPQYLGLSYNAGNKQILNYAMSSSLPKVAGMLGVPVPSTTQAINCGNLQCVYTHNCSPNTGAHTRT